MNGFEQGFGWPCRGASTLFPVAQRAEMDVDQGGELGLGQAGCLADLFDWKRLDMELAGGLTLTSYDGLAPTKPDTNSLLN